jgi:hypothetical protein
LEDGFDDQGSMVELGDHSPDQKIQNISFEKMPPENKNTQGKGLKKWVERPKGETRPVGRQLTQDNPSLKDKIDQLVSFEPTKKKAIHA